MSQQIPMPGPPVEAQPPSDAVRAAMLQMLKRRGRFHGRFEHGKGLPPGHQLPPQEPPHHLPPGFGNGPFPPHHVPPSFGPHFGPPIDGGNVVGGPTDIQAEIIRRLQHADPNRHPVGPPVTVPGGPLQPPHEAPQERNILPVAPNNPNGFDNQRGIPQLPIGGSGQKFIPERPNTGPQMRQKVLAGVAQRLLAARQQLGK